MSKQVPLQKSGVVTKSVKTGVKMKLSQKITGILLIFALLTSCVAATENKDLPTKEEITDFIAGIPVSDNYIITVFDAVKDKQPTWKCDTWVDKNGNQILSLYYVDPDSAKGYGSIYFNELGKEISMCGVKAALVKSYPGEAASKGSKEEVKETDEKETVTETEEESTEEEKKNVTEEKPVTTTEQTVATPKEPVTIPEQTVVTPGTVWDKQTIYRDIFVGVAVIFIGFVLRVN